MDVTIVSAHLLSATTQSAAPPPAPVPDSTGPTLISVAVNPPPRQGDEQNKRKRDAAGDGFDSLDRDHSKRIDRKEWTDAGLNSIDFDKNVSGPNGMIPADYKRMPDAVKSQVQWRKIDTSKDDSISLEEWKKGGGSEDDFKRAAGSDGKLNEQEFGDAWQSLEDRRAFDALDKNNANEKIDAKEWTDAGLDQDTFKKYAGSDEMTLDEYRKVPVEAKYNDPKDMGLNYDRLRGYDGVGAFVEKRKPRWD